MAEKYSVKTRGGDLVDDTSSQDQAVPPESRLKLQGFLEQQWPRVSWEPGDKLSDDIS